jgi:hypothetical protein
MSFANDEHTVAFRPYGAGIADMKADLAKTCVVLARSFTGS